MLSGMRADGELKAAGAAGTGRVVQLSSVNVDAHVFLHPRDSRGDS